MGIMMLPTMLIIFMFFGLGLDAGLWYFDHRWAQTQAEAAAAAGIVFLPSSSDTEARAAANDWLQRNGTDPAIDSTCPRSSVGNSVEVLPPGGPYTNVRVCVRRLRPSLFGTLSGISSVYVSAKARAQVEEIPSPYTLMAMRTPTCSGNNINTLYIHGPEVHSDGGTYTRSSCHDALHVQGTSSRLQTSVNDTPAGSWPSDQTTGGATLSPAALTQEFLDDPFEDVPVPPLSATCELTSGESNNPPPNLSPGNYCFELRVNSPVSLAPGVYVFRRGLRLTGNGGLTGTNVLLYDTCPTSPCNNTVPSDLVFQGTGSLSLSGRSDYENIVIWVDRTAGIGASVIFSGNSASGIDGRLYAYTSDVDIGGSPTASLTLNMNIVAGAIELQGAARIDLPYDATLAPPLRVLAIIE